MIACITPRTVAIRILTHDQPQPEATSYALAQFQADAVARAAQILRQRGGVIIADGVGLGKTFIAAALVEQHLDPTRPTVIAIPAALRRTWRQALLPLTDAHPGRVRLISHGQLSRGTTVERAAFVVVDEAHAFRNPGTRRYRALRLLCKSARVVLLTATPVNNSLSDLYFQIRLFASDDAFRDLGIGSLRGLLRATSDAPRAAVTRLRDSIIIRRSRNDLRAYYPRMSLPGGHVLRFPENVAVHTVGYQPLMPVDVLRSRLEELGFAAYGHAGQSPLFALSLLKRIQSGKAAALATVKRLIAFHQQSLTALDEGRTLRPGPLTRETEQLFFPALMLDPVPELTDTIAMRAAIEADLSVLSAFRREIAGAHDDKLPRLHRLLDSRPPPLRTIIFTEFRHTAEAIWKSLVSRGQVGLITGDDAFLGAQPAARWEVIKRFAPRANDVPAPSPGEAVFMLVATDVLAEGLNLQDADCVVSYDLPWNPVRLIQRAGRIDRIGSEHAIVQIYNFMPDREFDEFLRLVRTLREKLRQLRAAVGYDSPVLDADDIDEAFLSEVAAGGWRPSEPADPLLVPDVAASIQEAAPVGSIAVPFTAARILVAFSNGRAARWLLWDGDLREDRAEAIEILRAALTRDAPIGEEHPAIHRHIASAKRLLQGQCLAGGRAENAAVGRAVQNSVRRFGLLADSALLTLADNVLLHVSDLIGQNAEAVYRLRTANTPDALSEALTWIRSQCREYVRREAEWTLIGAVAVD
jgi:hypothetical protein